MTKAQFFDMLEQKLRGVPEPERTHILMRYDELFNRAMAAGEPEEQVAYRLLYENSRGSGGGTRDQGESPLRVVVVGFALALFNLIFVLAPFIAIIAVLFSLGLAGAVLVAAPFLYFITNGIPASITELLFVIFSSVAIFGLGLLLSVCISYLFPKFFWATGKYIRLNVRAARGY